MYEYTHVTMQLLDLMHVLFTRAMGVQTAWEREPCELWDMAWCPVLQVRNIIVNEKYCQARLLLIFAQISESQGVMFNNEQTR